MLKRLTLTHPPLPYPPPTAPHLPGHSAGPKGRGDGWMGRDVGISGPMLKEVLLPLICMAPFPSQTCALSRKPSSIKSLAEGPAAGASDKDIAAG